MTNVQHVITQGLGFPPRIILQGFNGHTSRTLKTIDSGLILRGLLSPGTSLITQSYGGAAHTHAIYSFDSPINTLHAFDSLIEHTDGLHTIHGILV